jgi:hypothetical protein
VDAVAEGGLEGSDALPDLNELLAPYASIEWWGRYVQLLVGEDEFARDLRRWFRERSGAVDAIDAELGGLAPIHADEMEDFESALIAYGEQAEIDLPREHVSAPPDPDPELLSAGQTVDNDERFATVDDVIEGEGDADSVLEGGAQGLHAAEAEDLVITDLGDPVASLQSVVAAGAGRSAGETGAGAGPNQTSLP